MIDSNLEDIFGKRYIIRQPHQNTAKTACQPLSFSDANQAYLFVNRLRTPHGYWQRALRLFSNCPAANDSSERQISQYLYRKQIFAYELVNYSKNSAGAQNRSIEQSNGDKYTFSHASVLLASNSLQQVDIYSKTDAEELLNELASDDKQLNELAKELELTSPKGVDSAASSNAIITALIAGDIVVTVQKKLASPPKPDAIMPATTADKPVETVSGTAAVKETLVQDPMSNINQKAQSETLKNASEDGKPFCEECEKAKTASAKEKQAK